MLLTLQQTIYTTTQLRQFDFSLPQIAFCGRSNVGKSSLINALGARKNLAKVSASPGKTRSINIYLASPENFYLVDLPGYGYARCSKKEREKWAKLIYSYLTGNADIVGLVALLDARLQPQHLDKELIFFAQKKGLPVVPVLTKADKCTQREIAVRRQEWKAYVPQKDIFVVSSKTGLGIQQLREALDKMIKDDE